MPHAIIGGQNGRRHEVGFDNLDIPVELYANDMGVEVVIEAVDGHRREKRFRAAAVVEAQ